MNELEFQTMGGPERRQAFLDDLEARIRAAGDPETKYRYQVGLKDVEFFVDYERARELGVILPMSSIDEAEQALQAHVITPEKFLEEDDTCHQVLEFDPAPVGYSGFTDCVIHSFAQTDLGLFEIGRYPAVELSTQGKTWQWFIHRRIRRQKEQPK